MKRQLILLTNDDGVKSLGLLSLRKELINYAEVVCIAPLEASSAVSKALTFHKPIRFSPIDFEDGAKGYSTTGAPADNVLVGLHILKRKPDLVVSGINYGDNSSIHSILTSGTCAAAFEAAFNNVPAIAFSSDLPDDSQLIEQQGIDFKQTAKISNEIVKIVLEMEWPRELAFINVNYPTEITEKTKIYVTHPALYKYDNFMVEKLDPRNLPYLWLWGERKKTFPKNSDTWAVSIKKSISITPIGFNLHEKTDQSLEAVSNIKDQMEGTL